ncbi:MAG: phytoene/squalene synthase family protein [Spirochaetes bacterium]|nr:phytoene/squalene synthase family protein [Spirochaetota bacterium]
MIDKQLYRIFKSGSKTYFTSSLFFPKEVKEDIFVLYSFVRTADNFIDRIPQNKKGFFKFKQKYLKTLKGQTGRDGIIDPFVRLIKKRNLNKKWVMSFLRSMQMDLFKKTYPTLHSTLRYIYGSAEVIGLMMAAILGLPERSYPYARLLGRAMQYINFIRDIPEDLSFGRIYLPLKDMKKFKLKNTDFSEAVKDPEKWTRFIRSQIKRFLIWQEKAEKGFNYMPRRYLVPIKTASDMYKWTSIKIYQDPLVVFRKKIKPSKLRIVLSILFNTVSL